MNRVEEYNQLSVINVQRKLRNSLKSKIEMNTDASLPMATYGYECGVCGAYFKIVFGVTHAACPRCDEEVYISSATWEEKKLQVRE